MASYPTLTYPDLLENATREELEQVLSLLQGYLSTEHKGDGTHKDITADSLDVSGSATIGEDLTVTDSVTAILDSTQNALARIIAAQSTGRDAIGPALVLQASASANDSMAIVVDTAVGGPQMKFLDLASSTLSYIMRLYQAAAGRYTLAPSVAMTAGTGVDLGADASGERFNNIYGLNIRATTAFYERSRTAPVGEWTSVTHADANFTGDATGNADWVVDAGDQITFKYRIVGKSLLVAFTIAGTDVANAPTELRMAIPGSFTAAARFDTVCSILDAGVPELGVCYVAASGTTINIQKIDGSAFTNTAADNTNVTGQIEFEVA